jgi:antitoxin ParD1/3/4
MAKRSTMNLSMPPALKAWVDEQVRAGGFGTASEYVRHLVREARLRQARSTIDAALLEGVRSGASKPMADEDWDDVRREGRRRLAGRGPRRKSA